MPRPPRVRRLPGRTPEEVANIIVDSEPRSALDEMVGAVMGPESEFMIGSPMPVGVVMSARNAPMIREAMRRARQTGGDTLDEVLNYFKARHPRLMSRVEFSKDNIDQYGLYLSGKTPLAEKRRGGQLGQAVVSDARSIDQPRATNIFGHELTHGIQDWKDARKGRVFTDEYWAEMKKAREEAQKNLEADIAGGKTLEQISFETPYGDKISPATMDTGEYLDEVAYFKNPYEVGAYKTGEAVASRAAKLDELAPYKPLDRVLDYVRGLPYRAFPWPR